MLFRSQVAGVGALTPDGDIPIALVVAALEEAGYKLDIRYNNALKPNELRIV